MVKLIARANDEYECITYTGAYDGDRAMKLSKTDMGDACKGVATDALTKIARYLGVGFDVY